MVHAGASPMAPFPFGQEGSSLTVTTLSMLPWFPPGVPSFLWCCFMRSCLLFSTNNETLSTENLTISNTNQQRQSHDLRIDQKALCLQSESQTMSRLPVVRAPTTTNKNVQFSNFCGPKPVKTHETVQSNMLVNTVLSNFPALRSTNLSIIVPFTDKTRK